MAFRIKRGQILRTTAPINVGKTRLKAGTRVVAVERLDKGHLRMKVNDPAYPKLKWENVEASFEVVEKAPRGRRPLEGAAQ